MTIYQTIEGSSSSQTWTANVMRPDGSIYSETFTHAAVVPASTALAMQDGSSDYSWKFPTSDPSSFRAIKKSGVIKMSDYDVGKKVSTNFVVRIPRRADMFFRRGLYTTTKDQKSFFDRDDYLFDLTAPYRIVGDLSHLRTLFAQSPYYPLDESQRSDVVQTAIADVMEDTVVRLNASYDPLTELAELRDSLELLHSLIKSAIHPIQALRSLSLKYKRSVDKSLWADAWMQYRYGIMPIIYSIHDVIETMKRSKLAYRTERVSRPLEWSATSQVGTGSQFYETLVSTVRVTGTGKVKASGSEILRLIDNLSINPFKTAWELIPFSFVVDWFVNVGSFIEAQTGSLMLFAPERSFCYAIKEQTVRSVYFRDFHDDRRTVWTGPWTVAQGNVFERSYKSVGGLYNAEYLLYRETVDSYSRRVFSPSDVNLRSDVFLNWKRWLDGFILSLGNTKRLLRK